MRKVLVLLLCAGIALPCFAAKKVTVQQLEELVAAVQARPDAYVAGKLAEVELSERLNSARALRLDQSMPGPMARGSLMALTDASAFLPLPANEIPAMAPPDPAEQSRLLDAATQYAQQTLAKMPNFFATRDTILFMDVPARPGRMTVPADQALQYVVRSSATVRYRNGKQVVEADVANGKKSESPLGLITSGEFGPILGTVLADARQGDLRWSHWAQGANGHQAVFRYVVPNQKSHYEAKFCCVSMNGGRGIFQRHAGYHGEIAVDPETGTILRLTMQADLKPPYPIARADLMVEYGPVEIGGKTYTCPLKSVAIARGFEPAFPAGTQGKPEGFGGLIQAENEADGVSDGPEILQTMLNHVVFRQYHLFRSETRILPEDDAPKDGIPPASVPPGPHPTGPTR